MAFDYKELTGAFLCLEALKRFTVQSSLKDSKVYFGQPPVLEYLAEHGQATQAELAAAVGVSAASMAVSVRRMQKSGLIEKAGDENDLRRNKISITDFGRQELDKLNGTFDEIDAKTYGGFSEAELTQLKEYLDRINRNLSEDLPDKRDICKFIHSDFDSKGGAD